MPSGRTHDRLTWLTTVPLVGVVGLTGHWDLAALAGVGSLFGGLYFSGDLDTVSRPSRRWGPLAWIWAPYRALVKHRGVHSHGLFWGPVFRLSYLLVMAAALGALAVAATRLAGYPTLSVQLATGLGLTLGAAGRLDPWVAGAFAFGIFYANAVHSLTDWTVSGAKAARRKVHRRERARSR